MAKCEVFIGYLIPRLCGKKGVAKCSKCGKSLCEEHSIVSEGKVFCEYCFNNIPYPDKSILSERFGYLYGYDYLYSSSMYDNSDTNEPIEDLS